MCPFELLIDDDALGRVGCAVAMVEGEVVAGLHFVTEDRGMPGELAEVRLSVRIEEELVWIEAMTGLGLVGSVDTVAVGSARADGGEVAVPDLVGVFGKCDSLQFLLAVIVKD